MTDYEGVDMSNGSNRATRVTVTVETATGDTFTVVEEPRPGLVGDNPRFIGQQFEDCLSRAKRRMSDAILVNYGEAQR